MAAAFALASAATILFAHVSPTGEIFVSGLLKGEILAVGAHELETLGVALGTTLAGIALLHRDFLVVSFDRESAIVLGKRATAIEAALTALIGLTVSAGTLTVGPVVLFGLLVLPPLAARGLARSMASFYWIAAGLGLAAAAGGVWASFTLDWPLGPAVVVVAATTLVPGALVARARG